MKTYTIYYKIKDETTTKYVAFPQEHEVSGKMTYERIERRLGNKRITTVTDDGEYYQRVEWDDGMITGVTKDNVLKMGWKSVKEFIANRPGFITIVEAKQ